MPGGPVELGASSVSQKYDKLKNLLMELFQLDQPDLDFGLYRVMRAKRAEVSSFLEKNLLPQVQDAFGQYRSSDRVEIQRHLDKAIEQARELEVDPETTKRVIDLRCQLKNEAVDIEALESEVYDHLFSFFRRYYSEGDFLANRVYKSGVYAIPYEGEEVTLYWANKDQYYIKTSEYLRDYAFLLRPEDEKKPMRVHFRLADATEGEHDNVKAVDDKERRFILTDLEESGRGFISEEDGEQGKELAIHFNYRPATHFDWPEDVRDGKKKAPGQNDLNALAVKRILSVGDPTLGEWIAALGKPLVTADGEQSDCNWLEGQLKRYTARNTFDYFIHKDLGAFLRRELDFYIKNEIMHLDDIENESAPRVEQFLSKIKVVRKIGTKIIDFLTQLENFQKKLWLKKKFVVDTNYLIAIGSIPEAFYPDIAANPAQREEWTRLCAIDQIKGDLIVPGYSADLTPEFLKMHPTLMVDTRHLGFAFTARLLEAIGELDDQMDGLLFHGENFQALRLMSARYQGQIQCVYIDPPYNAPKSEIAYKNNYKHSSFLSLIEGRLNVSKSLSSLDGSHIVAIDKNENNGVFRVLSEVFPSHDKVAVTVEHNRKGVQADHFSFTHEYALFAIPAARKTLNPRQRPETEWEWSNFRNWGGESLRTDGANCFYAVLVRDNKIIGFGDVWTDSNDHPIGANVKRGDGTIEIYPIDGDGVERKWRYERGTVEAIRDRLRIERPRKGNLQVKIAKTTDQFKTVWYSPRYNAGDNGTRLVREMGLPIGNFDYPKSVFTTRDCVFAVSDPDAIILDYFAGSGTTGHAVMDLNREDGGRRKFILVDMGGYFDTVLVPRIKKVSFTPKWKGGKPERLANPDEAKRSPRIVKVIRLESYEDTLNNLYTHRTEKQALLLDSPEAKGPDRLNEQYILRYMLESETRSSQSLLNVQALTDPTAYKLKVRQPGSDESREVNVDLLETFNWLIGLKVGHITAPQTFCAAFERDSEQRLRLKGGLTRKDGPYWFRGVVGSMSDGRRALVIWRKLTGEPEQDNLVLNEWFTGEGYTAGDFNFDLIYVNGGNNLENLKTQDQPWNVRLIEEDFHRLMFEMERV